MDDRSRIGVLGASSFVGECVVQQLRGNGRYIVALSRSPHNGETRSNVTWLQLRSSGSILGSIPTIREWVCVAPISELSQYFSMIETSGARRVVALSSTSILAKKDSSDQGEQALVRGLQAGEQALRTWAGAQEVEWVILRPTLIYGHGRDKNVTEIVRFVRRWGVFPLLGEAKGLRQPVHTEDVAAACIAALTRPAAANQTYTLSGGETLPYREMVSRIFTSTGKGPCLVTVPRWMFQAAVILVCMLPRYKHWTVQMAERMNRDLVFDHADARRDLGFSPRPFRLFPNDLPA